MYFKIMFVFSSVFAYDGNSFDLVFGSFDYV